MSRSIVETIVGFLIIVVVISFSWMVYNSTALMGYNGYNINISFDNIDGIDIGSKIKISGVEVGQVKSLELNKERYNVTVSCIIKSGVTIPVDSGASIVGSGLLGSKYVSIDIGAAEQSIADGGFIYNSQPSMDIGSLLSKFIFSKQSS